MAAPSGSTTKNQLPYPTPDDDVQVPRDIQALAEKLDTLIATQADLAAQNASQGAALANAVPAGVIELWAGAAAPAGWFLCQGQTVPAGANPGLAGVLGQAGGNVTLPDLRGRVIVGVSGSYALNGRGGAATVALSEAQMPVHSHNGVQVAARSVDTTGGPVTLRGTLNTPDMTVTAYNGIITENRGGNQAHENMPPYQALNYIIRGG